MSRISTTGFGSAIREPFVFAGFDFTNFAWQLPGMCGATYVPAAPDVPKRGGLATGGAIELLARKREGNSRQCSLDT